MKKPTSLATHWAHKEDWVDAQADLSLCWAHRSFCWFCHAVALFVLEIKLLSGCGHCKKMKPEYEEAADLLEDNDVRFQIIFYNSP